MIRISCNRRPSLFHMLAITFVNVPEKETDPLHASGWIGGGCDASGRYISIKCIHGPQRRQCWQ